MEPRAEENAAESCARMRPRNDSLPVSRMEWLNSKTLSKMKSESMIVVPAWRSQGVQISTVSMVTTGIVSCIDWSEIESKMNEIKMTCGGLNRGQE